MLYLFRQQSDRDTRIVPIAERTAWRLEQALLDPTKHSLVEHALAEDPYFVAWAAKVSGYEHTDTDALSRWLRTRLAAKLSSAIQWPRCLRVPAGDARQYARLAASGVISTCELLDCCPIDMLTDRRLPAFSPVAPRITSDATIIQGACAKYLLEEVADIEHRLPALIERVLQLEESQGEFDTRLQKEKLAALKQLAYGASHEINNPLANIAARAQSLERSEEDPERRRKLSAIYQQAMRAHEMIADLMLFAQPPRLQLEQVDIVSLTSGLVDELSDVAEEHAISLELCAEFASLVVEADPLQLSVAVRAVLQNSIEAIGNGGQILVSVGCDGGVVCLTVRDDGAGIPDAALRHLFDPFFSGREAGRGLGFGLSKCWRIVDEHGGSIDVESDAMLGTTFTLSLPVIGCAARAA